MKHVSLESLAEDIVGEHRVANPVLAQRLIRQAALRETGDADPTGVARTLAPVVRELFRAGADLETEAGSERSQRALRLTREYRALLREAGLLDPAEVLAEAALARPEPRAVYVRGYPRLGVQEVAFIDAIAGEGSTLHLPCAEDPVFAENREAAEELRGRGWTVKESPIPEPWDT